MITPNQIQEKVLSTSSHGYNIDEVNAFLNEIAESYAAIYAENKELYRKMEILASKIEEYREEEDSIKAAIITAQKAADGISKEAKENSERLLTESAEAAQKTVLDAKEKAEKLVSEARDYVTNFTKEKTDAANEIAAEAEKKASNIIGNAKAVAQDMIDQVKEISQELIVKAREEKEYHENLVSKLKEESALFKASLVSLYKAQLDKLQEMMEAPADAEKLAAEESLKNIESDIDNLYSEIDDFEAAIPSADEEEGEENSADEAESIEPEQSEETVEDVLEEDDAEAEAVIQESGVFELTEIDSDDDETVEEIKIETNEIEDITQITSDNGASMIDVDLNSAIDAFTKDEITPIDEHNISEITEEPEMEEAPKPAAEEYAFESFFNVKQTEGRSTEKISLIPPDDFEEDDDDLKFKGFFKRRKDKKHD